MGILPSKEFYQGYICVTCAIKHSLTWTASYLTKNNMDFDKSRKVKSPVQTPREKERMSELWNSGSHSVSSAFDYQAFYVCSHCRSIFRREEDLQRHLGEHDMMGINTEIKTETVKSEFPSEAPQPYEPRQLEQHTDTFGQIQVQQTMHSHETYQCEKCEQSCYSGATVENSWHDRAQREEFSQIWEQQKSQWRETTHMWSVWKRL